MVVTTTLTVAVPPFVSVILIWHEPAATDVTLNVADGPVPDAVNVAMPVQLVGAALAAVSVPL